MSVRDRIEARQMAERYQQQAAPKLREQIEQAENERIERLAKNAENIRNTNVALMLTECTADEREVVVTLLRDHPEKLGSADIVWATLEQVRVEGMENFRRVMRGTTKAEKSKVWDILYATGDPFARTGMDPDACEKALKQVKHDAWMNDEEN